MYVCTGVITQNAVLEADDAYPNGASIRLGSQGKGTIRLNEDSGELQWVLRGEALEVWVDGTASHGTLRNGVMVLDLMDSGVKLTLVREDARERLQAQQESLSAIWTGDWYGRWQIQDASGEFSDAWYDCCASILPDAGGTFTMILWDEDGSRQVPMGQVVLKAQENGEAVLCSDSGYFWFSQLKDGEWTLDPSASSFADTLEIRGQHVSEEADFAYSIVLRPWGLDWKDVPMEQQPFHYETWYLPLIQAGKSMPDRIG